MIRCGNCGKIVGWGGFIRGSRVGPNKTCKRCGAHLKTWLDVRTYSVGGVEKSLDMLKAAFRWCFPIGVTVVGGITLVALMFGHHKLFYWAFLFSFLVALMITTAFAMELQGDMMEGGVRVGCSIVAIVFLALFLFFTYVTYRDLPPSQSSRGDGDERRAPTMAQTRPWESKWRISPHNPPEPRERARRQRTGVLAASLPP